MINVDDGTTAAEVAAAVEKLGNPLATPPFQTSRTVSPFPGRLQGDTGAAGLWVDGRLWEPSLINT
ncbi:hypothetical protein [Streptomyces alfalfae]